MMQGRLIKVELACRVDGKLLDLLNVEGNKITLYRQGLLQKMEPTYHHAYRFELWEVQSKLIAVSYFLHADL